MPLLTMVFTDLVGSTAVKAALPGADAADRTAQFLRHVLDPHRAVVRRHLAARGGAEAGWRGDGFFLTFPSVRDAALFAIGVQKDHPLASPAGPVRVRIGMHTGEAVPDPAVPGDYVGREVDRAARLMALADGGQIVVSDATAALLRQAPPAGAGAHPHGDRELKGIGRVPVFELLYDGRPPHPVRDRLAPDNLPPPPRVTGRDRLLADLAGLIHAGGVVVLKGEGGMGKTTLALAAAHAALAAGDLPGGAAWVGCEAGPELAECLRRAAGVFFGDRCEAEPAAALGARVAAHLAAPGGLLVLDNFETVAGDGELIRWLAGVRPPARVLLTTREAPPGLPGAVVPVAELPRAEAAALFRARLAAPPPADVVDELCAAVGDQPLAVELLAGRAAGVPAARLLARVRQGLGVLDGRADPTRPDRHQSVRACFAVSVAGLPEAARELLLAVSVLPAGFGPEVVAAVAGTDDWDDAAEQLVGASLWRLAGDRYAVHPLVRQFAAEQLGDRRAEAERAAAAGVAAAARAADAGWRRPGADRKDRRQRYLGWFADELPNLTWAVGVARGGGDWGAVWGVAEASYSFWNGRGYWAAAERVYEAAVEAADRVGDPVRLAAGLTGLGFVYRHQGRWQEAEAAYRRGLAACDGSAGAAAAHAGRLHCGLGKVCLLQWRHDDALAHADQALARFWAAGDGAAETAALLVRAQAQIGPGHRPRFDRLSQAEDDLRTALDLAGRAGAAYRRREILFHLARVAAAADEDDEADRMFRESIDLARAAGNRNAEAKALCELAFVAGRRSGTADPVELFRESLALSRALGNRLQEGRCLFWLADALAGRGDAQVARGYAAEAIAVLRGTEERWLLALATRLALDLDRPSPPDD